MFRGEPRESTGAEEESPGKEKESTGAEEESPGAEKESTGAETSVREQRRRAQKSEQRGISGASLDAPISSPPTEFQGNLNLK